MRFRAAIGAGVLVIVAVGAVVFWFATDSDGYAKFRNVYASELQRHPEATLYFPGSTVVARHAFDMDRFELIGADSPAWVYTTLGVDATNSDLVAWYGRQVRALGYRDYGPQSDHGGEWSHGREVFLLQIIFPDQYGYQAIAQRTEYRVSYMVGLSYG